MCGYLPAPVTVSRRWAAVSGPLGHRDSVFFQLTCQMLETILPGHSRNDNSSSSIIPDEYARVRNALIELTFATISTRNENREAAPRLRLVGAFPPRKHTTVVALFHREDYLQGSEIPAVISPSWLVPTQTDAGTWAGTTMQAGPRSSHYGHPGQQVSWVAE